MDDGTLRHFDGQGSEQRVRASAPDDGPPTSVSAIAPDRAGGLYLADPRTRASCTPPPTATVLRQLRDPALAGVRQIQSSPDGRRLYGLVPSGVLVFDLPTTTTPPRVTTHSRHRDQL